MSRTDAPLLRTLSPIDGSVVVERPFATARELETTLERACEAQQSWQRMPLLERQTLIWRAIERLLASGDEIASELTLQMGRPIRHTPSELRGLAERARYMIDIAPSALALIEPAPVAGIRHFIRREALGLVAVIAPWNYPFLTSVNAIVPALLAGNVVVLKHSPQTPLVAERYTAAFRAAGLPDGVFQHLHLTQPDTLGMVADPRVAFVCFTGSVGGGHAVRRALADRFASMGLELGGKDPAYVREDADLAYAVEQLVDGSFFNAGQSCCGIKRIYVQRARYRDFVDAFAEEARRYVLGDPRDPATTLGPVVQTTTADRLRGQIDSAVRSGARALIDPARFPASRAGTPYLAPQVLIDVDHTMAVMRDESFGPLVGIMAVDSDDEALALMNDSAFGLTASLWTRDTQAAQQLGDRIDAGTIFLNRCDYLDPALAWGGRKDSGVGCTLSALGFEHLTRPKSFHLRERN